MQDRIFSNISNIVERDSKSTTYKYALLRAVIDIIQDNSPFINVSSERVSFPTGLVVEKWMQYYYPIMESDTTIPQIHGNTNLAFDKSLRKVIDGYRSIGGFSAFYNDLRNRGIPKHLRADVLVLAGQMRDTITRMPMKYIGRSLEQQYYSIFRVESGRSKRSSGEVDVAYLIDQFGSFSIPADYFQAFRLLGSFINGQDSLLFKWAEFSVNASGGRLSVQEVLNDVLKEPITERDVLESKKIYNSLLKKEGKVYCVWTGKRITRYAVDHVIPFSVWKNNDLWNLLPSSPATNGQKADKIPSPDLISQSKDLILHYWDLVHKSQSERFEKEFQVALLGSNPFSSWRSVGINQLSKNCEYLIFTRGYEKWL